MLKMNYVVESILHAFDVLNTSLDFSPKNQKINDSLSVLVKTLSRNYSPEEEMIILNHEKIKNIRTRLLEYLSHAEAEMEKYWADKFMQYDVLTMERLQEFWYWDNYERLVEDEISHLPYTGYTSKIGIFNIAPDDSIAFVGSGALPLTAIIMHMKTNMRVTCVDIDPVACDKARVIIEKAGFSDGIEVVCCSGENFSYRKNPFVFIASLIPDKEAVLRRVSDSGRQNFVAIRTAERLHTLLYEPVDEESEELWYCSYVDRTKHDPATINTTLFYQSDPGWHLNLDYRRTKGIRYHKFGWGCKKTI